MKWRSKIWAMEWGIPLGFGLVLCQAIPLRSALEFGADEGYELMKAWLVSLGHPLYGEFWNDQPPLHTVLLASLFKLFGPTAYIGRLLSVAFAVILVGTLYQVVRQLSGRVAGLLAAALLIGSVSFIRLSVSVMLELPAMALALAAAWAWFRYLQSKHSGWLVVSGVVFGCAMQLKFTAILFLPALVLNYLVSHWNSRPTSSEPTLPRWWHLSVVGLVWCGASLITFGVIMAGFYQKDTLRVFLGSHFSTETSEVVESQMYRFRPESVFGDFAISIPAILGLVLILLRRRWDLLMPVSLFVTALVIHSWHRPYWQYYHVHFSIPLAWLGAVGIVELFQIIWRQALGPAFLGKIRFGIGLLTWSVVTSLALSSLPQNLWHDFKRIRSARLAADDGVVAALKSRSDQVRWVFTHNRVAAFWAGQPIPPELAVIPRKRIWSGQISQGEILSCLERYRPEIILVPEEWVLKFRMTDYLRKHYQDEPDFGMERLYLRK